MRKPLVSPMMLWMGTAVTIQSFLLTALLVGPITALQLNGTTTTTAATPGVNHTSFSPSFDDGQQQQQTTIASFLQPDISGETTLGPQQLSVAINPVDELTTTTAPHISPSSSPLAKRHSSIVGGDDDDASPRFLTKASATEKVEQDSQEKPQRNGTRVSATKSNDDEEDGGGGEQQQSQSLSSGETTAEQQNNNNNNEDDDNTLASTTAREDEEGISSLSSSSSTANDQLDSSTSLDKQDDEESDTYFSAGDENEGDSDVRGGGEIGGDTIFPPEDQDLDSDESMGATTYASLLRPAPTTNPQTFSFSSQLANKLSRSGSSSGSGSRLANNNRLGTRGLSSKSELNAITTSTTTATTAAAASVTTTLKPPSTSTASGNSNIDDSVTSDSNTISHRNHTDSNADNNSSSGNLNSNNNSYNSSSSGSSSGFDINAGSFQSRSNANLRTTNQPQQQQSSSSSSPPTLRSARPTSSVINSYNSNTNHNNNLHNRIIKRKKLPFGSRASNSNNGTLSSVTPGSSLSSIYENSILTSTLSSTLAADGADNAEINGGSTTTVAASTTPSPILSSSSSSTNNLLDSGLSTVPGVAAAATSTTTESTNSLLNASQDDEAEQQKQSSAASVSGGIGGALGEDGNSNSSSSSNSSASLSSSRAILGFGTSPSSSSSSSNYGKVKRPKPIIIRDRDDSVYINNLPENSSSAGGGGIIDETATIAGVGEEESNKPVGSNALPTPPYKMRRVKLTSRRVSTPTTRPTEQSIFPTSPTFVLASTSVVEAVENTSSSTANNNGLMAQAASGQTDYREAEHIIRPSISHHPHEQYNNQPQFTSRRVFKQEFGITRNSYGDDHGGDDDDGDLQATTEYFSVENPTPYPMPMGVRSAAAAEESDDDNDDGNNSNEEQTGRGKPEKKSTDSSGGSGSGSQDSRYRDYYSEIRSRSAVPGIGSGNLHIKSADSGGGASVSSVTVTVTQTVVKTTPHVLPTAAFTAASEITLSSKINDHGDDDDETGGENSDDSNKREASSIHPNLLPTPVLPSSIFTATTTQSTFESGQGPADGILVSHSVENVEKSTRRYGTTEIGIIQSSHDDDSDKGNDQDEQSHDGKQQEKERTVENTPVMMMPEHEIAPTPTISSKSMKSVYFTQVEHPHFTSSSYEFTTSSMYSYSFPSHHDSYPDDHHHHDDHDDEHIDHHHQEGGDKQPMHSTSQDNKLAAASSEEPEGSHYPPEEHANGTQSTTAGVSIDGRNYSPSPTPPQFWDDLSSNLTKSSSSQVPITADQESAIPTPTIDIDIYPPLGTSPDSKPSDFEQDGSRATTTVMSSTGGGTSSSATTSGQMPGSLEDNEISEEEQRKQQQQNAAGTTTIKPSAAAPDTVTTAITSTFGKDKESQTGNKSETGKESKDKEDASASSGIKTPFGKGESFGIGKVHVPIMVQMVLDVAQPVFCSHLSNFKRMIVTVYGTQQKTKVSPEQIVVYTEPGCTSEKPATGDSTVVTVKPGSATTGKGLTTPKGTFPLTSPPPTSTATPDSKKSKSDGKDGASGSGKNESLSDFTKSSELLNNKSGVIGEEEISAHQNKSQIRSRRSTKMGSVSSSSAGSIKNANISEDAKEGMGSSSNSSSSSTTENLLDVYFYVNNKNGSYDQELTSSFVRLWNNSSGLSNVSAAGGGGDSSNNNNANTGESPADGGGGNEDGSSNFNNSTEMFIKRVKKVGMISASELVSAQEPADENSGIIVAITVASIVAVCLFVLGVGLLIMRHRQSQTKFAKRCTPVTLDDYSLDNISVYNSFRRKQRLRGSKRSYTNAAFDDHNAPSRPVNAQALASTLSDVAALENEFKAIPNITATLDDIPNGAETKNRYANVIPMPDTRVLLTFLEDTPNSDYINANFVRGAIGEQKRYIITQGPLDDTIVDFWRMVWEQQIRVILMLTDFAEGGIAKCAEYYPRSETIDCSQLHGDFQITLERRDIADNCITSYLVLKDMERNLRRDVVHFWYHSWPEKGVPASPKMTIDFLNRSKKFTKEPTPILVHCSPGTGRSGTVVACEIAMKEYDAQNKVDIPRIVLKIRQDRAAAVQTKEQYIHIYEVLHSYASRIGGSHLESI